ncbi:MAG: hypothetical protein O8C64_12515 [Candidatus Methanoperedens sp.]|nr:hypothetical protein [Candidatus Methanoperedens sp.]MCZ7403686.1 hypothetical protein [Candidatus Methanoperedens sp.]
MKLIEFIKPDWKKTILTLMLVLTSLSLAFIGMSMLFQVLFTPFADTLVILGYFDNFDNPSNWVLPVAALAEILPFYLVSCLIVFVWNYQMQKRK